MRDRLNETQPSTIAGEMIENTERHMPADYSSDDSRDAGMNNTNFESADINKRIGQRAYEIYQQRGGDHSDTDHSLQDWLQAEAEIRARSTTENTGQPVIEEDMDERYKTAHANTTR